MKKNDFTVQDVKDRYPDHCIVISNGHKDGVFGNYTLDEIPEYADRYVHSILSIDSNVIWLEVSVHSFYVPEYEGSEEEVTAE